MGDKLFIKSNIQFHRSKLTFGNLATFLVYIYILTLFVFAYDVQLNIISKLLFMAMTGCTLLYLFEKRSVRKGLIYPMLSAFGVLSLSSIFWSTNQSFAYSKNITLIQLIILAFIIYILVDTETKIIKTFNALYLGGYIMVLYALQDYGFTGLIEALLTGTRLGGDINQENAFGLYCGITFLVAMYHFFYDKKVIHLFLGVLPFLFAISSGSRKSILVLIIGLAVLYYFKNKNFRILKIIFILIILVVISRLIVSIPIFQQTFKRLFMLFNLFTNEGIVDSSTLVRKQMIEFGWNLFKEKPFFGYGTEQYNIQYLKQFGMFRPSHNNYIQALVSFGIVGFSLWYSMYFYIIKNTIKKAFTNNIAALVLCIFVVSLLNDVTAVSLTDKMSYVFIALGFSYCNLFYVS